MLTEIVYFQHVVQEPSGDIPWTLFLSSDRRMTRNLTRDVVNRRAHDHPTVANPMNEETWSQYFSVKCSSFVELCRHYPIATFIGSNRQMVRRVTAQAASGRRKK